LSTAQYVAVAVVGVVLWLVAIFVLMCIGTARVRMTCPRCGRRVFWMFKMRHSDVHEGACLGCRRFLRLENVAGRWTEVEEP
jgi:DNA-directed RNA polymerase subunit RPC12/RpoP